MRRLADGERAAMDEVYRGVAPRLRPLCVRMLGDTAEVADVIQQVLIDLFERASEYDTERDALSWALTIAVWHCRSERKRRVRRRSVSLAEGALPPADDNPEEALALRRDREAFVEAAGDQVRAIAIENEAGECVEPSLDTVLTGEYNPLGRQLFIYPSADALAKPQVLAFVEYYINNQATIAETAGFIPLNDDQQAEALDRVQSLAG